MKRWAVLAGVLLTLFATAEVPTAEASLIFYQGTLQDGVGSVDSVSSSGGSGDPITGRFWTFYGEQGATVTIEARRLEHDLDPAMWIFEGTFSDTLEFAGIIDTSDPGFLYFADDDISHPGPYGDPQAVVTLTLPGTGQYTAIVTEYWSGSDDGGDGRFDYEITGYGITNVTPEPATLVIWSLLSTLALGACWWRQRGVE